ncbi:MAG: hypothetical protein ACRYGI_18665, partial [Janthinobacterium lividum]
AAPASWQGWLATASFLVLVVVVISIFHGVLRWLSNCIVTIANNIQTDDLRLESHPATVWGRMQPECCASGN